MGQLTYLLIENYRGASTRFRLEFDKDRPVTLIFGENGTGKTTIADALDAIGNSSKGSLGDMSSTRPRQHIPTIGKKPVDILVEVGSASGIWSAKLNADTLTTTPQPAPRIQVLRRTKIRRFIDAAPADRYDELRGFIDVSAAERSENGLKDAVNQAKSDYDKAVSQRADAEDQLHRVWKDEGSLERDARSWAARVAAQDVGALEQQAERLRSVGREIISAEADATAFESAAAAQSDREAEVAEAERAIQSLPGDDGHRVAGLAAILTDVRAYLQPGTDPEECPVCQQGISLDALRSSLDERLEEHREHIRLRTARDETVRRRGAASGAREMARERLIASGRRLLAIVKRGDVGPVADAGIASTDFPELADAAAEQESAAGQARQLVAALAPIKDAIATEEKEATRMSGRVHGVRELHARITETTSRSAELEVLTKALGEAYEIARTTRLKFTQGILDDVTAECNRLYSLVHPGETLELSRLLLDEKKKGSLTQSARFEGHDGVPPQAYFSESHLDTLGFCFWLAMAKREHPDGDAVIVLDDVFTSIDAQHLNRIAQVIAEESQHFAHVIITTHQRQWRDLYRFQRGPGNHTQMVELQNWSLTKGISNFKTLLAVEELAASLDATPFDRQITSSKAGILLEAILDHLALQYRCRVARTHDGTYTLGELLDATEGLFKKLEIQRPALDGANQPHSPPTYTSSTDVLAIFKGIGSLAFLRNQVGAHFNPVGAEVSDTDIRGLAGLTVKLARALGCDACGQVPGKDTGTHFKCSCPVPSEVRLLPLKY